MNKISPLLNSQLPDFVVTDYPLFVEFMREYYKFIEQEGEAYNFIQNIPSNIDIDAAASTFVNKYFNTYASTIPQGAVVNKAFIVKIIKDFYLAKGTDKSIEMLFRLLFNKDVKFFYPSSEILRVSDGEWIRITYIKVTASSGNPFTLQYKKIQTNSGSAVIDRVEKNGNTYQLFLDLKTIVGSFSVGQNIYGSGVTLTITAVDSAPLGYYRGTRGLISQTNRLQDNRFYQPHSYVIKSEESLEKWEQTIKDTVHPAGMRVFSDCYTIGTNSTVPSNFFSTFSDLNTNYYIYFGGIEPWTNESNPPVPVIDASYTTDNWDRIISMKKVIPENVYYLLKRYDWEQRVFTEYDNTVNQLGVPFYCITNEYNVYLCVDNNSGATSTVRPTGFSNTNFTTNDGYTWRYMYNIAPIEANRFDLTEYIPVKNQNSAYIVMNPKNVGVFLELAVTDENLDFPVFNKYRRVGLLKNVLVSSQQSTLSTALVAKSIVMSDEFIGSFPANFTIKGTTSNAVGTVVGYDESKKTIYYVQTGINKNISFVVGDAISDGENIGTVKSLADSEVDRYSGTMVHAIHRTPITRSNNQTEKVIIVFPVALS